jgi:hypothetical protein
MEYCGALANFALLAVHRPTAIAAWNFPAILMHFRLFNPLETARDGTFQQALGTADALTQRSNSFQCTAKFLPAAVVYKS